MGMMNLMIMSSLHEQLRHFKRLSSWTSERQASHGPGEHSYIAIYLLAPWCRVLEKLTGLQLVKKFPAFHGTRRFITALTSVRHLSLSWTSPIQSIYPHPPPGLLPSSLTVAGNTSSNPSFTDSLAGHIESQIMKKAEYECCISMQRTASL